MFALKPDYEKSKKRMDAFWERELLDRPVVQFALEKPPDQRVPLPPSCHPTSAQRWLDAEYQAELSSAILSNQEFLGDTMPVAYPELGPGVFAGFYGAPILFDDYGTSWAEPCLHDWGDADHLHLDWASPYLQKCHELTNSLLATGKGKFITGMANWHPGGDCIAALRGTENLAADMVFHADRVQELLARIEGDYRQVYDVFYKKLRAAGQPISTHTALVHDGRFGIVLNDFSCMISQRMFDDVFLPGLARECQFLDRSLYHLDGPGALRHLDSILSIADLDAVQFVPGAGNEGFHKYVDVYRRAQSARKGIQVFCSLAELGLVMETLDPHGLYLTISDVPSREAAQTMLIRLAKWCRG